MEIDVKTSWSGTEVIVTADNVKIIEDISESLYGKKDDGSTDYTKRTGRDITDKYFGMFIDVMDEIAYDRNREFDSSGLIERLFDKLPSAKQELFYKWLLENYTFHEQD